MSYKRCGDFGGESNSTGEPCELPAGWGTSDPGEGRCKYHPPTPEERREYFRAVEGDFDETEEPEDFPLEVPQYLPPKGVEVWKDIVRRLEKRGILEDLDKEAIYHMVSAHYFAFVTGAKLMSEGLIEEDSAHGGRKRKHPAFQMWRDSLKQFRSLAGEFYMTPKERQDVELTEISEGISRMEEIVD